MMRWNSNDDIHLTNQLLYGFLHACFITYIAPYLTCYYKEPELLAYILSFLDLLQLSIASSHYKICLYIYIMSGQLQRHQICPRLSTFALVLLLLGLQCQDLAIP